MPVDSQYYQAEQAGGTAGAAPSADPPAPAELPDSPRDPSLDAARAAVAALPHERAGDAPRDDNGRWPRGVSGNPGGRPKGARNQATRAAEALLDQFARELTAEAIKRAVRGDAVSLRF